MAIKYTWNCKTVDTYPSHTDGQDPANTQSDVIYNVHWSLSGELIHNGITQSARTIGTQTLLTDNLSSFTDFGSITHDDVIAWTTGSMLAADSGSVNAKYASVSSSINLKINPTSVTKYLD